jgi:hypothetical protein
MRYGAAEEVSAAVQLATSLARRARQVEETAGDDPFAVVA